MHSSIEQAFGIVFTYRAPLLRFVLLVGIGVLVVFRVLLFVVALLLVVVVAVRLSAPLLLLVSLTQGEIVACLVVGGIKAKTLL